MAVRRMAAVTARDGCDPGTCWRATLTTVLDVVTSQKMRPHASPGGRGRRRRPSQSARLRRCGSPQQWAPIDFDWNACPKRAGRSASLSFVQFACVIVWRMHAAAAESWVRQINPDVSRTDPAGDADRMAQCAMPRASLRWAGPGRRRSLDLGLFAFYDGNREFERDLPMRS